MTDDRNIDPSTLTTQMIWREIGSLKELFETRFDAMQKAIDVAHDDAVRIPTEVQKQVSNLKEIHEEKIAAIRREMDSMEDGISGLRENAARHALADHQLALGIARIEESLSGHKQLVANQKVEASEAVKAAFAAEKAAGVEINKSRADAITKSENAVTKQIDSMGVLIAKAAEASDVKVNALKERVDRMESTGVGAAGAVQERQAAGSYTVAIIGAVIGVIGLVSGIIFALRP